MLRSFGLLVALVSVLTFVLCPSFCAFQNANAASKTENQSADSHCHGDASKTSNNPDHGKCNGDECCQPLISPASDSLSKLNISPVTLSVLINFTIPNVREGYALVHHIADATGPPRKADDLVFTLSFAPNAPPVS